MAFLLNMEAGLLSVMNDLAPRYYTEAKGAAAIETLHKLTTEPGAAAHLCG